MNMEGRLLTELRTVYSRQQVRTVLHREFLRATRTGRLLSLVIFEAENELDGRGMRRLGRVLLHNSRMTDDIGWFDEHRMCAVLSDTGVPGANAFARRISELARRRNIAVRWYIYTANTAAPDGPADDAGGAAARGRLAGADLPGEPSLSLTIADPVDTDGDGALSRSTRKIDGHAVEAMLPLLIRPMPLWKRLIDILGALAGLVLFSPLMLVIAVLIKLTSRGPVLFRQQRAGLGGRPFTIYKFRTMVCDAEQKKPLLRPHSHQDGPAFKMADDPRVTGLGWFLRKTSLDELPQFWNVLIGDMSLVGPRPLPLDEAAACAPWQRQRLCVTPGLTCTWQVKGRSRVTFDEWMRMDLQYIRRRSVLYDLKLLLLTIPAVLLGRGAY